MIIVLVMIVYIYIYIYLFYIHIHDFITEQDVCSIGYSAGQLSSEVFGINGSKMLRIMSLDPHHCHASKLPAHWAHCRLQLDYHLNQTEFASTGKRCSEHFRTRKNNTSHHWRILANIVHMCHGHRTMVILPLRGDACRKARLATQALRRNGASKWPWRFSAPENCGPSFTAAKMMI